jgi:hypothetical protein
MLVAEGIAEKGKQASDAISAEVMDRDLTAC